VFSLWWRLIDKPGKWHCEQDFQTRFQAEAEMRARERDDLEWVVLDRWEVPIPGR